MGETEPQSERGSVLSGPPSLTIAARSLRGPFASAGARLRIEPVRLSIANIGARRLRAILTLSLIRRSDDGSAVAGELGACCTVDEEDGFAPGEEVLVTIAGTVPARPGFYGSTLRITADDEAPLLIPVTIVVSANPIWGIACMLFGLAVVGSSTALTGENSVAAQLRDVLAARQLIHEWIERHPVPQRLDRDVAEMDTDYDAAIAALSRPRPLSPVDHRLDEAREWLQPAQAIAAALRDALKDRSPAEAEIADVSRDWQVLQEQMKAASHEPARGGAVLPGIAGRLDAFLDTWKQQFVGLPMRWVTLELMPQLDRVHLLLAAGQDDAARAQAIAVRRWIRRAAAMLDERLHTWLSFAEAAEAVAAADTAIRQSLAGADLPDSSRAAILAQLDQAAAKLGDTATPELFATAHNAVVDAETELLRARAEQLKQRVQAASEQALAETSADRIQPIVEAVMAVKPTSDDDKIAGLTRILAAWRGLIADVPDAQRRTALSGRADAVAQALTTGDLRATPELYRALLNAWSDWQSQHVAAVTAPLLRAECLAEREALLRNVVGTDQQIRLRPAGSQQEAWEAELDRIRLDAVQAMPTGDAVSDCLDVLGKLEQRRIRLSNAVFTDMLGSAAIPAAERIASAERSGVAEAIAMTRQLASAPRPLVLQIRTPAAERTVGRRLVFAIDGLDPLWGPGVLIGLDFQDGTPPLISNAEAIRQGAPLEHSYGVPQTLHPRLVAAEQLDATLTTPARLLGEGEATLLLRPSPVTRAEALADAFFNLRFGLALLVASVVYYWRFHASKRAFGEKGFDYVEAFAVGFAVSVAVTQLPEKLAEFAPVKA